MKAARYLAPLLLMLVACSSPQTTTPYVQLQRPAAVLAEVLKNYTETNTDCREYGTNKPRGHYYCSGVLARAVDDGNFLPWMYSPSAIAIGATSYSWMRQDVSQTQLYHPAGFILRNRIDAISHNLPGLESGWICLYPYDAGTSTANGHRGCGYRGRNNEKVSEPLPDDDNSQYAWGSCEPLGILTATQWDNHFASVGYQRPRQCSWNVDSQHGWNNMIASRDDFPQFRTVWNELLLTNYGDGSQMPKYIAAFFYDVNKAGGLIAAQHFQDKMNKAGYNVPILRINFTVTPGQRFSYVAGDQVVPQ
ncbi:hypothetical protein [Pseudomonas sp. NPDC090201]|uniref:hypothetical protein n=1 Tax=Pseudomonas sp. NPDC090201 TaxID=3364475 RepID=UPI003819C3A0